MSAADEPDHERAAMADAAANAALAAAMTALREIPPKTDAQIANRVALLLRPTLEVLCEVIEAQIDGAPCEIVLLVGAGDVVQYGANVPRERGIAHLRDLLGRWQAGVPDVLPEIGSGPSAAFRHLFGALQSPGPGATTENARDDLFRYVADLEAKAKR